MSKLAHVRMLPSCLQISSFSRSTRHDWGPFLEGRREWRQDFPFIDLFVAGSPQIDFPSWWYWRLLCCMQNFPLVDYVCCSLSCTTSTNILWSLWQKPELFLRLALKPFSGVAHFYSEGSIKPSLNVEMHRTPNESTHEHTQTVSHYHNSREQPEHGIQLKCSKTFRKESDVIPAGRGCHDFLRASILPR